MRISALVKFWVAIISIGAINAQAPDTYKYEYYFSLPFRESPYVPFNGLYPTSENRAKNKNHFRFKYDDQGKLLELAQMREGRLVANRFSNNFFMTVSRISFEYESNKKTLTYFNFKNESRDVDGVWKSVYTLDDQGNHKSLIYLDEAGNEVNNRWGISRYEWESDDQGRIIEKRYNVDGELAMIRPRFDFYMVRLTYDENGYLTQMDNLGTEGKLVNNSTGVSTDKLKYDENGNFIQWKVYDSEGKAVVGNLPGTAGGRHFYDEYGRQIKTELFDLKDELMVSNWGYAYTVREVDETGNVISYRPYDQNRETIQIGESVCWQKFEYNEVNQHTEITFFDCDNKEVTEPRQNISKAIYKYDKDYNMIERSYFDPEGSLVNNTMRGYAVEKYVYGSTSSEIDSLRFDANMKRIN